MVESPKQPLSRFTMALMAFRYMGVSLVTMVVLTILIIWAWLSGWSDVPFACIGLVFGLRVIYELAGFIGWLGRPRLAKGPPPNSVQPKD